MNGGMVAGFGKMSRGALLSHSVFREVGGGAYAPGH